MHHYVILDKPSAPEDLVVDEVFADNCQLAWAAPPDNGGAEINGKHTEKTAVKYIDKNIFVILLYDRITAFLVS